MTIRLLRVVLITHLGLVFGQAALAGQFLAGAAQFRLAHAALGDLIVLTGLTAVLFAALASRLGRRKGSAGWLLGTSALFVADVVQLGMGWSGQVRVHVPLGVTIFGLNALIIAALRGAVATREKGVATQ